MIDIIHVISGKPLVILLKDKLRSTSSSCIDHYNRLVPGVEMTSKIWC